MRKITLFLSALMASIGVSMAQVAPEGADDVASAKAYYIKCERAKKYVHAEASGVQFTLNSEGTLKAQFKFITVTGKDNAYKIYSVAQKKYVNDVKKGTYSDTEDGASTWYIMEQSATQDNESYTGFALRKDPVNDNTGNAWNDQSGGHQYVGYWNAADIGGIFTFEEAPAYTNDKYTTLAARYQAKINAWEAIGTGTGIGAIDANKLTAMENLINSTTATTWEAYAEAEENFSKKITFGNAINLPTGYYSMQAGDRTDNDYLSAAPGHYLVGLGNANATRSIWYITNNEDGTCTIQNYLTKEYIQEPNGEAVKTATTPFSLTVFTPFAGKTGVVVFGTESNKIHQANQKRGAWTNGWHAMPYNGNDNASNYTLVAIADPDLASYTTAENAKAAEQFANEYTPKYTEANDIAAVLGVAEVTTPTPSTLNDYFEINPNTLNLIPSVYAAAENNIYRLITRDNTILGINGDGKPAGIVSTDADAGATTSGNVGLLWQLRPVEDGFKLVNLNQDANNGNGTVSALSDATNNPTAATLTDFTNGGKFTMVVRNTAEKKIHFKAPNGWIMNMEGNGHGIGSYCLNGWGDSSPQFTIQKIENIDITLADVDGNAWASAYLPFGVKNEGEAEVLVSSQVNESTVTMAEATDVAAKNGFVVKAAVGTQKATLKIDNSAATTSVIGGSTVATTIDDSNRNSIYVLGKGKTNNKIGFYNLAANGTVAANKAYITAEAAVNGFVFDGEATAIESVESNTNSDASIYDLSGRRVSKATKGIFIINGKKVIR